MMARPLLFGATGQVGSELLTMGRFQVVPRAEADLTDPGALAACVLRHRPPMVINAAAYTAVDRAESDSRAAFAINRDGPAALAAACATLGIPLIHLSTDYVFDGTKSGAYRPEDRPNPLSVYGLSKLAGEDAIRALHRTAVILRTAWVFGPRRDNFVKTMVRLADRPDLRVVDDQWGGPTAARDVAQAVMTIAAAWNRGQGVPGTFHFCGGPPVSRFGFAQAIFDAMGLGPRLTAIPTSAYPLPARRPANSMLECTSLFDAYGIAMPDWRPTLPGILRMLPTQLPMAAE